MRNELTTIENLECIIPLILANEDPEHPLTDDELTIYCRRNGVLYGRQWVAKARTRLGIPNVIERRRSNCVFQKG